MAHRSMILIGATVGLTALALDISLANVVVAHFAFAGGAVFGRGYSLWEARPTPTEQQTDGGEER